MLWDMVLRCGGLYNRQTLRAFFIESVDISFRNAMSRWWAYNRETTLQDLASQDWSLLSLQGVQQKSAMKEGRQLTKVIRRKRRGPRDKGELGGVLKAQNSDTPISSDSNSPRSWKSWAQTVNEVSSEPLSENYESGFFFIDSGTYCRFSYCSSNETCRRCSLK